MSKTRDTGYLANVIQVHDTGVRIMSGSTMLMAISSSGAVTITGEMSGSDAANALLLSGTGSVGFTTTASFLVVSSSQQQISASYIALSGSYNTFSGSASTRTTQIENVYATTGSNSFRANQSITGSLVVSSTITAQTLVVQTVTSSIVYSSGSNLFGSQLTNTQTFTGSMFITGSNITANVDTTCFSGNICALNLISRCNIRVGVNGGYAVISGPTTGAAISLGSNSATFDRNLSLGLVDGNLAFSPILTINAQTGNVGIGDCAPDRRLYVTDPSATQGTLLAYNRCSTFCATVIEGITDRTSSSAFNLMNLKASTTSMFLVRGDGFSCHAGQVCVPTLIASSCLAVRSGTATIVVNAIAGQASNNHIILQRNDSQYASIGLNGSDNFTIFGTSTSCPRLTIDGSGSVGIGTNSPLAKLQIGDGTQSGINGASNKIHIASNTSGGRSALLTLANSSGAVTVEGQFESSAESADLRVIIGSTSNHDVVLRTNNVERMRITCSGAVLVNTACRNYLGTPNRYGIEVNGGTGGVIYALNISNTPVGYIFHDNSNLTIWNDKSGGPILVGPRFNNNGLQEQVYEGKMGGTTATSWDFCSFEEGGEGQVYKVEATFAHFAGWSYNTFYEGYAAARGTTVNTIDICNYATAQAGYFSVMKPTGSIFRVCKIAGSYGGTGWYWVKVTAVGPGF
jgi:hypothetical protein